MAQRRASYASFEHFSALECPCAEHRHQPDSGVFWQLMLPLFVLLFNYTLHFVYVICVICVICLCLLVYIYYVKHYVVVVHVVC